MYYFIYKTTCLITNSYYIGAHQTSNLEDNYLGSGKILNLSIKKYGIENHIREILEYCIDKEHLYDREREIVNVDLLKDNNCLNIKLGGSGGFDSGYITVKDKDNNKFRVSINDPRYINKELIPFHTGMKRSKQTIEKIKNSSKKRPSISEETREKMKLSQKNKIITSDTKQKLSISSKKRYEKRNEEIIDILDSYLNRDICIEMFNKIFNIVQKIDKKRFENFFI